MNQYNFQDHEGRELTASLLGEPGTRWVSFVCKHPGPIPYGTVPLKDLIKDPYEAGGWNGVLFPYGNLHSSREDEMVMLTIAMVEELAIWAQEAALGRLESTHE